MTLRIALDSFKTGGIETPPFSLVVIITADKNGRAVNRDPKTVGQAIPGWVH